MFYNILLKLAAILILIFTVLMSVIKPSTHKNIFVYDSNYEIVEEDIKTEKVEEIKQAQEVLPTQKQVPVVKTVVKHNDKVLNKSNEKVIEKESPEKVVQVQKTENKIKQDEVKPIVQKIEKKQEQTVEIQKLSQEEIDWNIWRSNIQNRIMDDAKLPPVPMGTIFKFSFTVDMYGKITNVKSYSTNSKYTPYAIQFISPVIRSYQGQSFLEFPKNSKRTITDVNGAWIISNKAEYSTPNDFNDTERIKYKN